MTIDSKITVRAANPDYSFSKPPIFEPKATQSSGCKERLFLCPQFCIKATEGGLNSVGRSRFKTRVSPFKKLRKCLAFKAKFYYNNVLYVVGTRLMHGVAKLRKVAEVFITDIDYLKLPHIANSKRTIVAK